MSKFILFSALLSFINNYRIKSMATFDELHVLHLLKEHMTNTIKWSAYNWIRPSLWSSLFGKALNASKSNK